MVNTHRCMRTHTCTQTLGTVISELVSTRPVIDQQGIAGDRLDIKVPTQAYTHTHTLSHEAVESRSERAAPGGCLSRSINNISRFFIHFTLSVQSLLFTVCVETHPVYCWMFYLDRAAILTSSVL